VAVSKPRDERDNVGSRLGVGVDLSDTGDTAELAVLEGPPMIGRGR
jgi:hypothetical protein